ncbi:MAG: ABC transporter permease subunit [Mycoplasmataceae bacterium]|nr:ABC transporter permease subunit [Mycoplasmataceae bacterium]
MKILNKENFEKDFNKKYKVDFNKIPSNYFKFKKLTFLDNETISNKRYSYWLNVFKTLIASPIFILSGIVFIAIFIASMVISNNAVPIPNSALRPGTGAEMPGWYVPLNEKESKLFLFGFGSNGEDYWKECWIGTKNTFIFALVVIAFQLVLGLILGLIWGFFKKSDILFINITNIINLMPSIVFILVAIFLMGKGFWPIVIAITIQSWISFASATRIQTMIIRNREYNIMSKLLATNNFKIMIKNILPKIAPIVISVGSFAIPDAISMDASLSYLNYGFVDGINTTTLGFILQSVLSSTKWLTTPSLIIFPSLIIIIISFSFFLFSYKFANALNPRYQK